jgi:hypothetical protein
MGARERYPKTIKEKTNQMRKIGFIILALVLALGSIGIGYAAWTDEIVVTGTVNTGDVDINVEGYSWTLVYKITMYEPEPVDEIIVVRQNNYEDPSMPVPIIDPLGGPPTLAEAHMPGTCSLDCLKAGSHLWLVSWAIAAPTLDADGNEVDDAVTIHFGNLFPSIDFVADVLLHYDGSIPAKVNVPVDFSYNGDEGLALLYQPKPYPNPDPPDEHTGIWVWGFEYDETQDPPTLTFIETVEPADGEGIQFHECDYVLVEFHIHLPQDNDLMDLSGSFTANLEVVQWNEWPYNPAAGTPQ